MGNGGERDIIQTGGLAGSREFESMIIIGRGLESRWWWSRRKAVTRWLFRWRGGR
jgi:hypothetical protein